MLNTEIPALEPQGAEHFQILVECLQLSGCHLFILEDHCRDSKVV